MNKNILGVNGCAKDCHEAAVKGGWWHDAEGRKKDRNIGELLCLIHSEISEAMEGARKGLMDNHLKHKSIPLIGGPVIPSFFIKTKSFFHNKT